MSGGVEWLLGILAAIVLLLSWYLAFGIERRRGR